MRELNVKTTDCSCENFLKIAGKCGFLVFMSKKHCKVKTIEGKFITMIPRHSVLAKHTAKGILERFNEFGAKITIS